MSTLNTVIHHKVLASTPHAEDYDCQKNQDDRGALTCSEAADNSIIMDTTESPQQENDMGMFSLQTLVSQLLVCNIFTLFPLIHPAPPPS